MKNINVDNKMWILSIVTLHIILGIVSSSVKVVPAAWGMFVFMLGVYLIFKHKNRHGEAHYFAAYIMASEVFYRMSGAGLPWDFARYAIIFIIVFGLLMEEKKQEKPWMILLYFVLMLPAIYLTVDYYIDIDVTEIRKRITFNLLGPLLLTLSTFYFYKREFTLKDFERFSRWMLYPILMTSALVFLNVGDYSALEYHYSSNFAASGGFSGNQVSIVFGLGILILGINILIGNKVFVSSIVDVGVVILFSFQGLMTFSRGGMLSGILALAFGAFVYYFSSINRFLSFLKIHLFKFVLAGILGVSAFMYTNEITGGFLYARYFNVKEDGYKVKDDITTGRGDISVGDLELFVDRDYIGVGPGVSMKERPVMKDFAAHIEFTRMLAEHGLLGLISLLIMLLFPFIHFIKVLVGGETVFVFTSLMAVSLMSMTHAAMRLTMIGLLYGVAFIYITHTKKRNEIQQ